MRSQTIKAITVTLVSVAVTALNVFEPVVLAQSNGKTPTLRGFTNASSAAQIRWEEKMRAIPKPELLRATGDPRARAYDALSHRWGLE